MELMGGVVMSQAQKVHYDRNDEEIDLRDVFGESCFDGGRL